MREYRDYWEPRVSFGGVTPAVKWLLIANLGLYFLMLVIGRFTSVDFRTWYETFGFVPQQVLEGHRYWQLFTYAFVHDVWPLHVGFNMLFLWLVGRELEILLSTRGFLTFYFLAAFIAALVYAVGAYAFQDAKAAPMFGASGAVMGLLVLFAIYYPMAELPVLIISLHAWLAVTIYIAADVCFLLAAKYGSGVASMAHLGGAGFGYVWYKTHPRVTGFFAELERKIEKKEREEARDLEERVDEILRKIKDVGVEGLSREERAVLERASKHFRKQNKT